MEIDQISTMALQGLLAGADPSKPPLKPSEAAKLAYEYAFQLHHILNRFEYDELNSIDK